MHTMRGGKERTNTASLQRSAGSTATWLRAGRTAPGDPVRSPGEGQGGGFLGGPPTSPEWLEHTGEPLRGGTTVPSDFSVLDV